MHSHSSVQLLHITDLHALPVEGATIYGADTHEALRSVLSAALALPAAPEVIVATGDLSEDGSPASYRRLRGLLLETGLPVHVVPGNHDAIGPLREALLGGPIGMGPVVELGRWRLVLLDSQVPGRPHGHLAPAQLELLRAALAADPDRPALVALHHGPASYCPSSGCQLDNAAALLELLAAHPSARGVLAGHGHLEVERAAAHTRLLTTPSTCSQAWHAQLGAAVDHEDFWASHGYDARRRGFRTLALAGDGEIESRVHWVESGGAVSPAA